MSLSHNKVKFQIESNSTFIASFQIKINVKKTILNLLEEIAKITGIPVEYEVLYKTQPTISNKNASTFRDESLRIDDQPLKSGSSKSLPKPKNNNIEEIIVFQEKELKRVEESRLKWQSQTLEQIGLIQDQTLKICPRHLRGDHIHSLVAFYVDQDELDENGKIKSFGSVPLNIALDRPNQEFIYELKHISQLFPHFGVHGGYELSNFSMSLSHIHSGTSWSGFYDTEGPGANIDKFLEQTGIWIWEKKSMRYPSHGPLSAILTDKNTMFDFPLTTQFKDGRRLASNFVLDENELNPTSNISASSFNKSNDKDKMILKGMCTGGNNNSSHSENQDKIVTKTWNSSDYSQNRLLLGNSKEKVWRMYYYSYMTQNKPSFVTEENFGRTWLNENLSTVIFSYERRDNIYQPCRKLILDRFLYMANISSTIGPRLYQPYLDTTDIVTLKKGQKPKMSNLPYNVSGNLVLGFDGTWFPMGNYKKRSLEDWKKSWIWKYIFRNDDKTEALKLDL